MNSGASLPPFHPQVVLAASGLGHVARGFERATVEIARALQDASTPVLTVRGGGRWMDAQGVRVPCVQRFGRLASTLSIPEAAAYTAEQRSFAVFLYGVLRATRTPAVHLHDPGTMNVVWHLRRRLGGEFRLVFTDGGSYSPEHLHRPDVIHCLTPLHEKQMLDYGHPRSRVHLVPYGVRRPERMANPGGGGLLRVVGVGALSPGKGVDTALRAIAPLLGTQLTFLGQQTPETPKMAKLAQETLPGRHTFATVDPAEVPRYLADAHVFILPTRAEAFGLAILEAMAAGLACVVSDLPVTRWLVGDAAILVPPEDVQGWTRALASLTPARRVALGKRAQARAAEFTWPALAPRYLSMYAPPPTAGALS